MFVIARDQSRAFDQTEGLDLVNIVLDPEYIGSVHPLREDWTSWPWWKPGEVPGECLYLGSTEYARCLDLVQRMECEIEAQGEETRVAEAAAPMRCG